jgi:Fe-S-cluster containining protein
MNRHERRAAASGARRGRNGDNPVASPAAELHQRVVDDERRQGSEVLSKGLSPQHVYDLVDSAVALADSYMAQSPTSPKALACGRGCNHCCHRPVGTTAPSVLRIAAALREQLTEAEFAQALARVVALDEKTHGMPWTLAGRPPFPCAFLVDGACSIYGVRPLVCRGWNSADEDTCRRALAEESVEMRFDLYQRTTFAAAEQGIKAALGARGLDGTDLELIAAIRVALENPDACERWLAREPVFAGCEAKRSPPPANRRSLPLAKDAATPPRRLR